jgi:hypothetical protein
MPTVAHLVQKYVRSLPHLEQSIERDVVSFHRLARYLRAQIEAELGKEVDEGAIVMALSRLRDKMGERREKQQASPVWGQIQLSLREGAVEIDLLRGPKTEGATHRLRALMDGSPDDIFNIVSGQYEVTLIASAKYEKRFLDALKGEKVIHTERDLSFLYLRFPQEILYTPGFYTRVLSELAWEDINVFELVSTLNELILVLKSKDAARAYDLLRRQLRAPGPKEKG